MKCKIPNRGTLIDNYLSGILSNDETEQFEEHYFDCDICFKETKFRQELKNLIKDEGKNLLEELKQDTPQKTMPTNSRLPVIWWQKLIGPGLAYALVIVLFVSGGSFLVVNLTNDDPLKMYAYDNKVPYEFSGSGLRGTETRLGTDPELRSFREQILIAMSDYVIFNYQEAIEILEPLEPTANDFLRRLDNKEIISDVRDYYFYLGVSHYALGRSEKLGKKVRAEHLEKAIPYLEKAEQITLDNSLENSDREVYYLGLTYGFGGREEDAISKLKKIDVNGNYYQESSELISNWSN